MASSKWIRFGTPSPSKSGKTKEWGVMTTKDDTPVYLGVVKWMGRWRRYAFFPEPNMVFEQTCLRDLASFCDQQNGAHRKASRENSGI